MGKKQRKRVVMVLMSRIVSASFDTGDELSIFSTKLEGTTSDIQVVDGELIVLHSSLCLNS